MSGTPGWYPDPAGVAGRFRYWDGQSWSAETTADPTQPPPRAPSSRPGPETPERPTRNRALLIGVVAGVLVLVLAAVFGLRALLADDGSISGPPPPSSTVSAWDETSRPDTPTPSPSDPPESVECPDGDPSARTDHPDDDRVHGGGLSFPRVDGWGEASAAGLSWTYDVDAITDDVEPGWFSMLAVGALRMADGFETAEASAVMISQCVSTSNYYSDISGVTQLESAEVTVDGHPGWRVRTEIRVDQPDMEAEGDVLDIIVVDTGDGESLGMFLGAVPIDDEERLGILADTESALGVD